MFPYYYSTLSFALMSIRQFIILYLNIPLLLGLSNYFPIINKDTENLYELTSSSVVWLSLLTDS